MNRHWDDVRRTEAVGEVVLGLLWVAAVITLCVLLLVM